MKLKPNVANAKLSLEQYAKLMHQLNDFNKSNLNIMVRYALTHLGDRSWFMEDLACRYYILYDLRN